MIHGCQEKLERKICQEKLERKIRHHEEEEKEGITGEGAWIMHENEITAQKEMIRQLCVCLVHSLMQGEKGNLNRAAGLRKFYGTS